MPENSPDGDVTKNSEAPSRQGTGGPAGWTPPSVEELQRLLPNYEIIKIIGQGGMGAVYAGRQLSLDRLVAIKILPESALINQEVGDDPVERFKNEARSMARMNHPGIVSVYDFGETTADQFYLVMEHVDGTDVAQMIVAQGRLPDGHALSITAHVCDALHYAHSHGVIHRDIKPANILLNREGQVKIADFGLAKKMDSGATNITRANITMGTPDFIAPEALIQGLTVDHRSDIYSVGVMLYNMLTGEVPRGAFKMPSAKVGSDPRFDAIILKAIQSERDERYQSTQDMRRDLDVILTIPMVKLIQTGGAAVPARGVSAKVTSRPVATGTKRVTTRARPMTATGLTPGAGAARAITAGLKPAPGTGSAARAAVVPDTVEDEPFTGTLPPQRNPVFLYGGIAVLACVVVGVGWWMMNAGGSRDGKSTPAVTTDAANVKSTSTSTAASSGSPNKPPVPAPGGGLPSKFTELAQVPRNQWFKVLYSKESAANKKSVEWRDGWVDCRGSSELLNFTDLVGNHKVQNMALKAVVRPPERGREWIWTFRESSHGSYRLVVRNDRLGLDHDDRDSGVGQLSRLREGSFAKELATASQWTLEASIRGDRFWVAINGSEVFSQDKLKLLEAGTCWLRMGNASSMAFKEVSFKVLDDTVDPNAIAVSSSPPSAVKSFQNHRYQMFPDRVRWSEAKARAESMGGHLATITSREEYDWVVENFIKPLPVGLGLWIGGTNAGTPAQWRWITGETFSFNQWLPTEPNNRIDEPGLLFIINDSSTIGWLDLREEGMGMKDRRAGYLLEMDDQRMSAGESTLMPAPRKWEDVSADATNSSAPFKSSKWADVAVRLRFQGGEGAQLHLRVDQPQFYRAMRTRDGVVLDVYDGRSNRTVRPLIAFDHLPVWAENTAHELVFAARGEILAVWMDGKYIGSARDLGISSGAVGYHLPGGAQLKSLEIGELGSGDSGAAAVAVAATPNPEFEKRISQIEQQFQAAYDRDIGKAHAASVQEFDNKYLAALDRAIATVVKEGKQDEAQKLRDEKQRLAEHRPLPSAEEDATLPESLKQLRGTYRSTLAQMEVERDRKAQTYYDRCDRLLEDYQKELTQQQKYDDAIKVKSLRSEWSAKRPKADGGPSA